MKRIIVCVGFVLMVAALCLARCASSASEATQTERRMVLDRGSCILSLSSRYAADGQGKLRVKLENRSGNCTYHLQFTDESGTVFAADAAPGATITETLPLSALRTLTVSADHFSAIYTLPTDILRRNSGIRCRC